MEAVPLLDLRAQYKPLKTEIEREVRRVMDAQTFVLGEPVEKLEQEGFHGEAGDYNDPRNTYLNEVLAESDPTAAIAALGTVARARGMARLARSTGLGRESLYKALSPGGNPEFATVLKVVRALGLKLHAEAEHV